MIIDLEKKTIDKSYEYDICIIGSGVAGLSIVNEFINDSTRVVVLEGGGNKDESRSQKIYQSDVVGEEHDGVHNGRFRVFGGTSTRWGGQLMTYRRDDLEYRDYITNSGWPINYDSLAPYYKRAESIMKVNDLSYECDLWDELKVKPVPFISNNFIYRFSKWASFKNRNLAKTTGRILEKSRNIDVLLHANAVEIVLKSDQKEVESIKVKSFSRDVIYVKSRYYIVCTGTIETARLLLASKSLNPRGVGNDFDNVGRYFQDHISYRAARLYPTDPKSFSNTFNPYYRGKTMHSCKIDMSKTMQSKHRSTHVMGHIAYSFSEESGLYELRRVLRAIQSKKNPIPSPIAAWRILRIADDFVRLFLGAWFRKRRLAPKKSKCYLFLEAEQMPRRDSRVMLSDELDELGMPRTILDWKISDDEKHAMQLYMDNFKSEWERLNLGKAKWSDEIYNDGHEWIGKSSDTFHQTGTTRMSVRPEDGVVDPDLKVHGVNNLYIGSCSVFPTGGTANPTLTMMALCIRLSDHIKNNISG